jgi:hypothetical protein
MDKRWARAVRVSCGVVLIGAGLVDGAWNPFAFVTAPILLSTGAGLLAISDGKSP